MLGSIRHIANKPRQARAIQPLGGFSGGNAPRGPEQVAPMTVWLCTDAAAQVNGQIFQVSGNSISLLSHPSPICTLITDRETWSLDDLDSLVPAQLMVG